MIVNYFIWKKNKKEARRRRTDIDIVKFCRESTGAIQTLTE